MLGFYSYSNEKLKLPLNRGNDTDQSSQTMFLTVPGSKLNEGSVSTRREYQG